MQVIHESINKEYLALKLNCLNEKSTRWESHIDFLSCCIKDCLRLLRFKIGIGTND